MRIFAGGGSRTRIENKEHGVEFFICDKLYRKSNNELQTIEKKGVVTLYFFLDEGRVVVGRISARNVTTRPTKVKANQQTNRALRQYFQLTKTFVQTKTLFAALSAVGLLQKDPQLSEKREYFPASQR